MHFPVIDIYTRFDITGAYSAAVLYSAVCSYDGFQCRGYFHGIGQLPYNFLH